MKNLKFLVAALALSCSMGALSDSKTFNAKVKNVLVDDSNFAGCMVNLTVDPQTYLPNCETWWGTMDCLNLFPESTSSISANKLAQAQLALITGKGVRVRITDSRKANGYCFVSRIDVNDQF